MDNPTPQKKGFGPLAWVGIGCGGIIVLGIIGAVLFSVFFGSKIKAWGEGAAKNPTRAAANFVVSMGVGEMVAEDDVQKRYTVKEKKSGTLTTFYWSKKANAPAQVTGDFSAIPPDDMGTPPSNDSAPVATPQPAPPN
jgi:hypothetical protein